MKLQFKIQTFQTAAVDSIADCFAGQPFHDGVSYRIDPGKSTQLKMGEDSGLRNADIQLSGSELLERIQAVQRRENLPPSTALAASKAGPVNLDIEMETGTGKTYVYIKTIMELHKRYGWSKYIVVVPSDRHSRGRQEDLRHHRRSLPADLRNQAALVRLQLGPTARARELLVGRRHAGDDHQHPGVQRARARTTGASTRCLTTSSPAGRST